MIEQYYRDEYNNLCKRVAHRAGGAYNAEDVVQEAFVRALKYWNSFNPEKQQIGGWFSTILNNALKDFCREELQYGMCNELNDEVLDVEEETTLSDARIEAVEALINSTGGVVRDVLNLVYMKGYKPSEVTQVLDVNNKFVRATCYNFKKRVLGNLQP